MLAAELRAKIRDIQDFPTEGILFRDITTLLRDGPAWRAVIDHLASTYAKGFIPVRKRGKLPFKTIEEEYTLEYGTDILAIHEDAIRPGQRVLAVDDLLATGGTMAATFKLVERLGGVIVGAAFLIELAFLGGRARLEKYPLNSLIVYE
jgi:adenine phosphoribosyltransferase